MEETERAIDHLLKADSWAAVHACVVEYPVLVEPSTVDAIQRIIASPQLGEFTAAMLEDYVQYLETPTLLNQLADRTDLHWLEAHALFGDNVAAALDAFAQYGQQGDVGLLDTAIKLWTQILQNPQFEFTPLGYRHYAYDAVSAAQITRYTARNQTEDLSVGIETIERTISETAESSRFLPRRLTNLAGALAQRAYRENDEKDLVRAVEASTKAVARTAPEDPLLPGRVNNLIGSLAGLHEFTKDPALLKRAMAEFDAIISSPEMDDATRARLYHCQGMALRQVYSSDDAIETLNDTLAAFQTAVDCSSPAFPDRALYLGDLAIALGTRFEEVNDREDLDAAIRYLEEAVDIASVPNETFKKNHQVLATTLQIRFDNFENREDLAKATTSLAIVFSLEDSNDPSWKSALQNYGRCLEYRLALITEALKTEETTGDTLEELSDVQWRLYEITHDEQLRSDALNNSRDEIQLRSGKKRRDAQLSLAERLAKTDDAPPREDIDEAIQLMEDAAEEAPQDDLNIYESNKAWMLIKRYRLWEEAADLQDGLALMEKHLAQTQQIEAVANYLAAVDLEFEQGNLDRLDKAIAEGIKSLERQRGFSAARCQVVSGTAENLRRRYERQGETADVDQAWDITLEGTDQGRRQDHLCAPIYNAMGWAARTRFDISSELEYLEQAIAAYQNAVDLSANAAVYLTNLGTSLRARHTVLNDEADLDRSIATLRDAVDNSKGGIGEELAWMSLANSLSQRFRSSKSLADIDEAIHAYEQALAGNNERAKQGTSINLARALLDKNGVAPKKKLLTQAIKQLDQWQLEDLAPQAQPTFAITLADAYTARAAKNDSSQATTLYRHAIETGRVFDLDIAMAAATSWMEACFATENWEEATEVAEFSLELIDEVLDVTLNLRNKSRWLRLVGELPTQCAYVFAKQDAMDKSVLAIEDSRARVMSESLELGRRDLSRLTELGHGRLYDEFTSLAAQLRESEFATGRSLYQQDLAAASRTKVEARFHEVLEEIRKITGYEDLLNRDAPSTLATACANRPLVYLLTTTAGGLAIVVHLEKDELAFSAIWLPELRKDKFHAHLGLDDLANKSSYLGAFLGYRHDPRQFWEPWKEALEQSCTWMGRTAFEQLLSELPTDFRTSGITLIPCGYLSILPWHAARLTSGDFASAVMPVGYSPNARALVRYRKSPPEDNLLLVAEPKPVSSIPLPFVDYETQQTLKVWPADKCTVLEANDATVENVTGNLEAHGVFHFVGHAHADIIEPSRSGLQMSNDEVLTVEALADQKIDLQLAILSACETAVPGFETVNELISLPTALVQVGSRSVIGSMWLVLDQASALLIGEFHRHWRKDNCSTLDALHKAQQTLRESGMEHPAYWAAFTFTGLD